MVKMLVCIVEMPYDITSIFKVGSSLLLLVYFSVLFVKLI